MAFDPDANYTVKQWGRRYPDGRIDWQTADNWEPTWSTKEGRDGERQAYLGVLQNVGITPTEDMRLVFLSREKTVTYSEAEVVTEAPEPEPEPEPTPEPEPVPEPAPTEEPTP